MRIRIGWVTAMTRTLFVGWAVLLASVLQGQSLAPPFVTDEQARGSGYGHPWQGGSGDVNLYSLAKETDLPLVSWTARGGLPMGFSLHHNSQAIGNNLA